jgi:nitrogen fixation protein NifB
MHYLKDLLKTAPQTAVVGIAGPGDPFANVEETLETLSRVRREYPEMLLCVASNGLNVAEHAARLAELEVSHVTLTINAVDPEIGAKIYGWVRDGKRVYRGTEGARRLLDRQLDAIAALKKHGVTVKINTIIVPGINDHHAVDIARTVSELGADLSNCIAFYPVEGTPFASIEPPGAAEVAAIRHEVGQFLPLMHHCTRCRADAVGLLGQAMPVNLLGSLREAATMPLEPGADRPHVAAASREGMLVNLHLGEAEQFHIYSKQDDQYELVETRPAPSPGSGNRRWEQLATSLHDCRAVLVSSAGPTPKAVLGKQGIRVVMMEGLIDEGLEAIYENRSLRSPLRRQHRCGAGCAGDGTGCD